MTNSDNTTAACSGGELLPCPFCGNHLQAKRGKINPYARCVTPDCFGAKMPVVSLDVASDIEKWNSRATQASAPRSASAGGDREALEQIDTLAVCTGVVDPKQHANMLANIARIARAALSAPPPIRIDQDVGIREMVERALTVNVGLIQGFTYDDHHAIRDFRQDYASGVEIWRTHAPNPVAFHTRLAFEKLKAQLIAALASNPLEGKGAK